jgi:hypothetical protein
MTTGRINQVTIFDGRQTIHPGGVSGRLPNPTERAGVSQLDGTGPKSPPGLPLLSKGANPRASLQRPSICHNWIPQGRVRQREVFLLKVLTCFGMAASRGGYLLPVTSPVFLLKVLTV